jgi:hypothetical protein
MRKLAVVFLFSIAATAGAGAPPETVICFYHPQKGKEAELEKVIRESWAIMSRLDMIDDQPRVFTRGTDGEGRAYFVTVLTWKSADLPDNAPPDLKKNWAAMQAAVENREGRRGIHFEEMQLLPLK